MPGSARSVHAPSTAYCGVGKCNIAYRLEHALNFNLRRSAIDLRRSTKVREKKKGEGERKREGRDRRSR